jgi:asparagine synthase (glutamine-hydrolysing)
MCGICGIYNLSSTTPVTLVQLVAMNATMLHRGPDDGGEWLAPDGHIGLANRRLAIIDLSPAGHQPMSNEGGSVWIAYNGEVYNFAALRAELERKGHSFRSRSDTETLVHLYEEEGPELVRRLRGMFAFAIWDARRRELFLARDRVGIKPLYYALVDGQLIFGSEVKALIASGRVRPALNRAALVQYLALGYVAPPDTLFDGIRKLEPGHWLIAGPDGLRVERYWDVFDGVAPQPARGEAELVDQIHAQLEEAVRLRLVADVPVGVFLSGGIDSSLVAACAARATGQAVKSFTLGFRDHPEYNELDHARRVAGFLGAEAHEVLIGPEEVREFFPRFVDFQEEPVANPIWFAIYFVSRLARDNGVIVVLSGDGGDELYAGYNRWMEYLRLYDRGWRHFGALPQPARALAGAVARPLLRRANQRELARRSVAGEELFWGGTVFKPEELQAMCAPDLHTDGALWNALPLARWRADFERLPGAHADLDWMSYAALKGNLLEDFLMRLDKMGMAASIEGRVPLLDHEFIRFSQSIPAAAKYPGYHNKRLLRQVARRLLPAEIVDRPKTGFCAPVEAWLAGAFGAQLADGLAELQAHERVFAPAWLESVLARARGVCIPGGGGAGLGSSDWALLALGQWYARWIAR